MGIIDKMIKQRRESIAQFDRGSRPDLAAAEQAEIDILQAYMPKPLSEAEIDTLVADAVEKAGASGMSAMGRVMSVLKAELAGRADMSQVSAKVKARLAQ